MSNPVKKLGDRWTKKQSEWLFTHCLAYCWSIKNCKKTWPNQLPQAWPHEVHSFLIGYYDDGTDRYLCHPQSFDAGQKFKRDLTSTDGHASKFIARVYWWFVTRWAGSAGYQELMSVTDALGIVYRLNDYPDAKEFIAQEWFFQVFLKILCDKVQTFIPFPGDDD